MLTAPRRGGRRRRRRCRRPGGGRPTAAPPPHPTAEVAETSLQSHGLAAAELLKTDGGTTTSGGRMGPVPRGRCWHE